MIVHDRFPLADRTTLGVGGTARHYIEFREETELRDALAFARDRGLPVFLLGGGSNVVLSSGVYPGVILSPQVRGIEVERIGNGRQRWTVGAAEEWDAVVRASVERGLTGIECLAGIPGRTGGTPVQNVGAYGQEVSETIRSVRAFDRETGQVAEIPGAECGFAYRRSRFNHEEPGRRILLTVTFELCEGETSALRYEDLRRYFGANATPTPEQTYHAVREIRARKGMVSDPADPDTRSAGSFFKNPVLSAERFEALRERAKRRGIDPVPNYPQPDGTVKLPAAFLMETAGLTRGQAFRDGRVALSTKHILALTNRGGATGEDIALTAREVQNRVRDAWEVSLAPEPVFVGFAENASLPDAATVAR
ncbi:MAG: UDP-N-acetylmuramate dehydrogenase [Capsulimonadales bacterium]|nr:UDP-N-acetylmuramate dehydrogenase [Capsulimonadales bacterium]